MPLIGPDAWAAARELTLAPLRPAAAELAAHQAQLLRLYHALGGELAWFHQSVWPELLDWERRVAGLPTLSADGSALGRVLTRALDAAEQAPLRNDPGACDRRLALARQAALAQAALCTQVVQLRAAGGDSWDAQRVDARAWRSRAAPPQRCRVRSEPAAGDPCGEAALGLVRRGIWHDQAPRGRWLSAAQGWALLWPLAGRDLQAALASAAAASGFATRSTAPLRRVDPEGLQGILDALSVAGYLADGLGPLPALRANGKPVVVLPVAPRLRRRCGLPTQLPRTPAIAISRPERAVP